MTTPAPTEDSTYDLEGQWLHVEAEALKTALSNVKVADATNGERPVQVTFTMPDAEIVEQQFPFITIDLIDIAENTPYVMSGYNPLQYPPPGTAVPDGYAQTFEPHAILPMLLTFQVTSWARQIRHDRSILTQLMHGALHPRFGQVAASDGTDRRLIIQFSGKRDTMTGGRRLFRNIWTVKMQSEIFTTQYSLTKLAEQVIINPVGVPSDAPASMSTPNVEYP